MESIAVIADDLTGACDAGIKIVGEGFDTNVLVNIESCDDLRNNGELFFSVNTDTRDDIQEMAYNKVRNVVSYLRQHGIKWYYKKIDSTLRGNIGCEIDAILDELNADIAVISPALPDNGRILKNGILVISNSVYSHDEQIPAQEIICSTSGKKSTCINLETVRKGHLALAQAISEAQSNGYKLILIDAVTNEDLKITALAINLFKDKVLPVGSAGLINHFTDLFENKSSCSKEVKNDCKHKRELIAVAVGTRHPVSLEQVKMLKNNKNLQFYILDVEKLITEDLEKLVDDFSKEIIESVKSLDKSKDGIVLTTNRIYNGCASSDDEFAKPGSASVADTLANILTRVINEIPEICKLVLTGGDTAGSVLNSLGIHQIKLDYEPMPGIVVGELIGNTERKISIVTKSGGFGDKDTLVKLVDISKFRKDR